MAKHRMVVTSVWRKSRRFRPCSRNARYLYLYLLTNEDTELCGIYEQDWEDLLLWADMDEGEAAEAFKELEDRGLAAYRNGWVLILNYKAVVANPNVRKGVEEGLATLPEWVQQEFDSFSRSSQGSESLSKPSKGLESIPEDGDKNTTNESIINNIKESESLGKPFEASVSLSKPLEESYTPTTTTTSSTTRTSTSARTDDEDSLPGQEAVRDDDEPFPETRKTKPLSALKDPLANSYQEWFVHIAPPGTWGSIERERKSCNDLAKKTRALLPETPYDTEMELASMLFKTFLEMRKWGKSEYWKTAAVVPSEMLSRWAKICAQLAENYQLQESLGAL